MNNILFKCTEFEYRQSFDKSVSRYAKYTNRGFIFVTNNNQIYIYNICI